MVVDGVGEGVRVEDGEEQLDIADDGGVAGK